MHKEKHWGELRSEIDEVLANKNLTLKDTYTLVKDVVLEHGKGKGLNDTEIADLASKAYRYSSTALVKNSWQEGNKTNKIKGGEFITDEAKEEKKKEPSEVIESVGKLDSDGYVIEETTDGEVITLSAPVLNTIKTIDKGEVVLPEELAYALGKLEEIHGISKDKNQQAVVKDYIDILADFYSDKNKVEEEVIEKDEEVTWEDVAGDKFKLPKRIVNTTNELVERVKPKANEDVDLDSIAEAHADAQKALQKSDWYEDANAIDRKKAVKKITSLFNTKNFNLEQDTNMASQSEKTEFESAVLGIADNAPSGDLGASKALKDVLNLISDKIKLNVITKSQADTLGTAAKAMDVNDTESVERFLDYADKVFDGLNDQKTIQDSSKYKKALRKLVKDKKGDATNREVAKDLLNINPLYIQNINKFNNVAKALLETLSKSTVKGLRSVSDIAAIGDIIEEMTIEQNKVLEKKAERKAKRKPKAKKTQEDKDKKADEAKEVVLSNFNIARQALKNLLKSGVEPITGESLDFDKKELERLNKIINIDHTLLTIPQVLSITDGLNNFLVNYNMGGLDPLLASYEGLIANRNLAKEGVVGKPYFGVAPKFVNTFTSRVFTHLPVFFENVFRGQSVSTKFLRAIGFADFVGAVAETETYINNVMKSYQDKFHKLKANGDDFRAGINVVERGMYAYLRRSPANADIQQEFDKRMGHIKDSVERLSKGNSTEVKMSKVYEAVYNKLKDAKDANELDSYVDKTNRDAVQFLTDEWAKHHDSLSDLMYNMHNEILSSDINYTPDVNRRVSYGKKALEEGKNADDFFGQSALAMFAKNISTEKAGVLFHKTPQPVLADGRYISFDFDNNMRGSLNAAVLDVKSAYTLRKLKSAITADSFENIIPDTTTRKSVYSIIKDYVSASRGQGKITSEESRIVNNVLNKISKYITQSTLGKVTMAVAQTIPAITNTIVNTAPLTNFRVGFDLTAAFNKKINNFINRSGYGVANRGVESYGAFDSLTKQLDTTKGYSSKSEFAGKIANMYLENFLVKPDVAVARASWIAYYKAKLYTKGVNVNNIDWDTHVVDKEAGDYAQNMLDKQQNPSDANLLGRMYKDKSASIKLLRMMLMPFSSFRMNQSSRLRADLAIILNGNKEDSIASWRSIAGTLAEIAMFNAVNKVVYDSLISMLESDDDEEEEDAEKSNRGAFKMMASNVVADVFSPHPLVDGLMLSALNSINANFLKDEEDEDYDLNYNPFNSPAMMDKYEAFGMFGAGYKKSKEYMNVLDMAVGEYYIAENYGKKSKRYLSDEDREVMQIAASAYSLHLMGILPAETAMLVRNIAKKVHKNSLTEKEFESGLTGDEILYENGASSGYAPIVE
jgi:hypothetical protein